MTLRMLSSRHAAPAPLLACLLALLSVAGVLRQSTQAGAIDFYQFWVVGRALEEHPAVDPYAEAGRERLGRLYLSEALDLGERTSQRHREVAQFRRTLGNYSTPALYALFSVFESGDFERDARCFELLSGTAFVLGLALLCRLLRYTWTATWLAIALLATWFAPFASDVAVMNVNRLQLGAIGAVAWLASRGGLRLAAGAALLGAAVAVKPNLACAALAFALALGAESRWRALATWSAAGALGAATAFAGSGLVWGSVDPWSRWTVAVRELLADWSSHTIEWGNHATALAVSEATGFTPPGLFWIGTAAIAGALLVGRRRPAGAADEARSSRTTLALGAGLVLGLLGARLTWLHYDLLAVPLLLVLWRPRGAAENLARRATRVALGTFGFACVALRPAQMLALAETPLEQALSTNAGLCALFVAALIELARGADYGSSPEPTVASRV